MGPSVKRPGPGWWEWVEGERGRGVRAFRATGRLIWSSWIQSAEGIQFDDGIAQAFADYLDGGAPPFPVPPEVDSELRAFIR